MSPSTARGLRTTRAACPFGATERGTQETCSQGPTDRWRARRCAAMRRHELPNRSPQRAQRIQSYRHRRACPRLPQGPSDPIHGALGRALQPAWWGSTPESGHGRSSPGRPATGYCVARVNRGHSVDFPLTGRPRWTGLGSTRSSARSTLRPGSVSGRRGAAARGHLREDRRPRCPQGRGSPPRPRLHRHSSIRWQADCGTQGRQARAPQPARQLLFPPQPADTVSDPVGPNGGPSPPLFG